MKSDGARLCGFFRIGGDERAFAAGKRGRQQHHANENVFGAADIRPDDRLMPAFEPGLSGPDAVELVADIGEQQSRQQPANAWATVAMSGLESKVEGVWNLVSGTGKFSGITGGGKFQARSTTPVTVEMTWEGEYALPN